MINYLKQICISILSDRVNEYSDEDEENDFSSTEENYDNADVALTSYDGGKQEYRTKRDLRKYRKLDRSENDQDDGALGGNPADSDSEFENIKEKGSRNKISRVS